jgi:signal transduction histidine kinase
VNGPRSLVRRFAFDLLVLLAALESAAEVAFRDDPVRAPRTTLWFTVPAIVVLFLPLLARRRFPFAGPAAVWIVAASVSFVDGRLVVFPSAVFVAGLAAAFLLGNLNDGFQARVGLVIVLAAAAVVTYNDPSRSAGEFIFLPVLCAIVWTVGLALRARAEEAGAAEVRAERAERERETLARIAVAEERTRIARELHDIVAHAMSVMVLQVGAVRHGLPDDLAEDRQALEDVERTGRTALTEMRRLLGAMRRETDDVDLAPQPGLGAMEPLLEEVRRTGLQVELDVEGEPVSLSRALDLSAYRIVQEGLTNVLKHANATRAAVTITYAPSELRLDVRDNGHDGAGGSRPGHGLVGIRERVKIYGGELDAATQSDGGFLLSARLPLQRDGR